MRVLEEVNKSWYMLGDRKRAKPFAISNMIWLGLTCLEAAVLWQLLPNTPIGFLIYGLVMILALFILNPISAHIFTSQLLRR